MRYLVLSDVHANSVALEAVLSHAGRRRWEGVLFLGDAVGYYPAPERATSLLRELKPEAALLGNHDALLLALTEDEEPAGAGLVTEILKRQRHQLSPENLAFIRSFRTRLLGDGWEATHGALRSPWDYLASLIAAQNNLPLMRTDLCFVGHTHIPMAYVCVSVNGDDCWRAVPFRGERAVYRLPPKARVFFNPGSVGQPRDGLPLASYAIFDEALRLIELFRVPFDIVKVQRAVRTHRYPEALAARLGVGR